MQDDSKRKDREDQRNKRIEMKQKYNNRLR